MVVGGLGVKYKFKYAFIPIPIKLICTKTKCVIKLHMEQRKQECQIVTYFDADDWHYIFIDFVL